MGVDAGVDGSGCGDRREHGRVTSTCGDSCAVVFRYIHGACKGINELMIYLCITKPFLTHHHARNRAYIHASLHSIQHPSTPVDTPAHSYQHPHPRPLLTASRTHVSLSATAMLPKRPLYTCTTGRQESSAKKKEKEKKGGRGNSLILILWFWF